MQGSRREPLALRHSAFAFWIVAAIVLAVDQAVKAMVRQSMVEGQSIPVIDGVFHLTYVRNVGAAFGLFPGYQPVFIATSCVVLVVVAAYWRRSRPRAWPIVVALGLITGGAIGNLIDRVALGRVTDVFDVAMIDFPVFNIADAAIVIGVGILIAWLLLVPEDDQPAAQAEHQVDAAAACEADDERRRGAVGEEADGMTSLTESAGAASE